MSQHTCDIQRSPLQSAGSRDSGGPLVEQSGPVTKAIQPISFRDDVSNNGIVAQPPIQLGTIDRDARILTELVERDGAVEDVAVNQRIE